MKIKICFRSGPLGRWIVSFLILSVLAACSNQIPATATATALESIPVTGQETATPLLSAPSPNSQADTFMPVCKAPAALTPALTEGPYFKADSPERTSLLENSVTGTKLTLTGFVLTNDCKPVAHALLDFWQANSQGQYDNAGYTLRGHQYTDDNGRYQLVTVVPGLYPGRTEHIHVKVQAPNGPILTSQLFFPGVPDNSADGIYNPALLITIQSNTSNDMQATYNFIVEGSH